MNKREILIILNRLHDVTEDDDIEAKLTLNQSDATILYKYLLDLKKCHQRDIELIDTISSLIQKNR